MESSTSRRRDLHQLDEDVAGRLWIQEGDPRIRVANPRPLVDQRNSLLLELGQRGFDVIDLKADMKKTLAVSRNPLSGLGIVAVGFQKFDVRLTDRVHRQPRMVLGQVLFIFEAESQL